MEGAHASHWPTVGGMDRTTLGATRRAERLLYRVRDAAAVISVSERTMWYLIGAGEIETLSIEGARCTRVSHQALVEYVRRREVAARAAARKAAS